MAQVKLVVEYDGTDYYGFQKQKYHSSIQYELECALSKLCNEPVRVVSSGRTDSGVHAKGHVVNFQTTAALPLSSIVKGVNSYLPYDIVVRNAQYVSSHFHARFSAKQKVYRYTLWNAPVRSPLVSRFTYHYAYPLDIAAMRKAARILQGRHDFKAFCAQNRTKKDTIRSLYAITIRKKGYLITCTFTGDGFLYNMVRNIVGTLLLVGRGKIVYRDVCAILHSKDRSKAGPTAPAQGLLLVRVMY